MDAEKGVAVAEAEGRRQEEVEKVRSYSRFLYFGTMIVGIAPASRPVVVPRLPAGYDLLVTCATFTVATLVVQKMLARVLERRPAPAPRLTRRPRGRSASSPGYSDHCFVRSWSEWAAARVASSANLAMATRTVEN